MLQVLLPELEQIAADGDCKASEGPAKKVSEKITPVARRILPSLRQYSSWLVSNVFWLLAQNDELSMIHIEELWKIYAETLTALTATFQVSGLPEAEYLLEEDEDTIGFKPLRGNATRERYCQRDGSSKPRSTRQGVERLHPSEEMSSRIREVVRDGLLVVEKASSTEVHGFIVLTAQ